MKNPILHKVLQEAEHFKNFPDKRLLAIFDLDSTLFDVEPRISKILKEFAADSKYRELYPRACSVIEKVGKLPKEYHVKNYLATFGLTDQPAEFYREIFEFWRKRFFNDSYLQFDRPYPGAIEYVRELDTHGADIIYLTGRDEARMGRGTRESLLAFNFPLDDNRSKLVLKPHHSMDDAAYKRDFLLPIEAAHGPIYFFENELENIELVVSHAPHVQIIFFDSVHSGLGAPLLPGTPTIEDFLLD